VIAAAQTMPELFNLPSITCKKYAEERLTVVQNYGCLYEEEVLTAVQNNFNGCSLRDVSERLRNDKKVVIAAVQNNGWALQFASKELQNDKQVVMTAIQTNGRSLQDASERLRNDKKVVIAAVQNNGWALQFASKELKNNREVVLIAVKKNGYTLEDASERLRNDKEVVIAAIANEHGALEFASEELKNVMQDAWGVKEFAMAAVNRDPRNLHKIPREFQNDKQFHQIALAAVRKDPDAIKYVGEKFQNDDEIALAALRRYPDAIKYVGGKFRNDKKIALGVVNMFPAAMKYVGEKFQNDKEIALAAVRKDPDAIKYVGEKFQNDEEIALAALRRYPDAMKYVGETIRNDKEIALAAVRKDPDAIKYVGEYIKHDSELLTAAGMFDADHIDSATRKKMMTNSTIKKIVLSTRFSLNVESTSQATRFTKLLKENEHIRQNNFKIYAPNAFDKKTCDPNWTDFDHPCRGTDDTCEYKNELTKEGQPTDNCCWRYSFRRQLEEAKFTGGFMLQLVEGDGLGKGQTIEKQMAEELSLKIFHVIQPIVLNSNVERPFDERNIEEVASAIKCWYNFRDNPLYARFVPPVTALEVIRPGLYGHTINEDTALFD